MKTIAIAILALSLGACATTPDQRAIDQQKADQIFGEAKRYLAIATIAVPLYNLLPVCGTTALPFPACYDETLANVLNIGLKEAGEAVVDAEKVFADANSGDAVRASYANLAKTIVMKLVTKLGEYGLAKA